MLPEMARLPGETAQAHRERLLASRPDAKYDVLVVPLNAADYGAAQKRHRVLIVGARRELGLTLHVPSPTHSQERLVWDKWVSQDYWKRHGLVTPAKSVATAAELRLLSKLEKTGGPPSTLAWRTCRDAFQGLDAPGPTSRFKNHLVQPGAKAYPGHTGSPLDEPAKALKAGVHGVPGGENMIDFGDGTVRYFSVREAARLQGLPDDYAFACSWSEAMRQLGNAVPVELSRMAGAWLGQLL